MKRSEMLDFMYKTWRDYIDKNSIESFGLREALDNLLEKMEAKGMKNHYPKLNANWEIKDKVGWKDEG